MEVFNYFKTQDEFDKYKTMLSKPNVNYIEDVDVVIYNYEDPFQGIEYVDLGLPSGNLWATCNIGAKKPEDVGNLYQWGAIKSGGDGWKTTPFNAESTAYNQTAFNDAMLECGEGGSNLKLAAAYDPCTKLCGGMWKTPTDDEYNELEQYCQYEFVTDSEYNTIGVKFTSRQNGNTLYIPSIVPFKYTEKPACWFNKTGADNGRGDCAYSLVIYQGSGGDVYAYPIERCTLLPLRPIINVSELED